ncbi:MAG: SUMF1/EgtB/PvdO family nonheme iron enzyme [Planctomycetaceae bacterium]|nr:SUMF1/EgtB/PvdO family nonheme iron enzyme [Planctomycetaceae bacterium]
MKSHVWQKYVFACLILVILGSSGKERVEAQDALAKKGSTVATDPDHPITKIGPIYNTNDFPVNTVESVRRAIVDMIETFGDAYPDGSANLKMLADFENRLAESPSDRALQDEFAAFRKKALLANPLLDQFDKLVLVRASRLAAPPLNAYTNTEMSRNGWDHELVMMTNLRDNPRFQVIYKPEKDRPVRDLDLHWDADRVLFSTISDAPGANERWGVFEINLDGTGIRQLTPDDQTDVDFFDACYLADGNDIITASTACMQGLPCENGSRPMAVLYRVNPETKNVRQLTFEQDSDWHPTMLANGRVMYLRWEYSDIMHYYSRILFTMNPDGTNQMALHGSGSYFPTAFKHARPMPDHPHEVIGVVGGHHGRGETGRLCIIDPSLGNKYPFKYRPESKHWGPENTKIDIPTEVFPAEVTGFTAEIPGYGRDVVGNVFDEQGEHLKYNFIYPFPLNRNYYLCSLNKTGEGGNFGIYLVDRFDNMTPICVERGKSFFEPIPIMKPVKPPVLADRVDLTSDTANVFMTDIYQGPGLADIPRGTVKKLRVFSYHFGYIGSGGHESVGVESSWDIKRILGTVDVEEDGSAFFTIPANTPLSVQPLDADNRALQLFRSWFVGMPGENVSCVGCHENQANVTPASYASAAVRTPKPITPWYGVPRPVAFESEVYVPVVKKFCIGCHDGSDANRKAPSFADAKTAYDNIHPFVNRPGPETDQEMLPPFEYHASSSELVQTLQRGHYNVELDDEAWDRLCCWIDLNAPWRGKWQNEPQEKRRLELLKLYANIDDNPEDEYDGALALARRNAPEFVPPKPWVQPADALTLQNWPFSAEHAAAKQRQLGATERTLDLGGGVTMKLRRIPAGEFIMGSNDGFPDEAPRSVVRIEKPFWIGETEVTNAQYEAFDPVHDSRYHSEHGKDHVTPGYIANHPKQPVSRVSWLEANKFCDWLSQQTKLKVKLPTEAQWEWAARSGSADRFYYGGWDEDFSKYANLADASRRFLYAQWEDGSTIHVRNPYPENSVFPLRDDRFVDNHFVVDYVAQCLPNAWGLYDMIGNNAEWTRSDAKAYPYRDNDGRNDGSLEVKKIARGGSWIDRPKVTGSATRYHYEPHQKVYVVGFRVVIEE